MSYGTASRLVFCLVGLVDPYYLVSTCLYKITHTHVHGSNKHCETENKQTEDN